MAYAVGIRRIRQQSISLSYVLTAATYQGDSFLYCDGSHLLKGIPKYAGADNEETIRSILRDRGKRPLNIRCGLNRLLDQFKP